MSWIDRTLLDHVWSAVGGAAEPTEQVQFHGPRVLGSLYPVADLAAAAVGAAGVALAEFAQPGGSVVVDRPLAAGWFGMSFRPDGWEVPDPWDSVALRGLTERHRTGLGSVSQVSLARTAMFLQDFKAHPDEGPVVPFEPVGLTAEQTHWGPGHRLPGPVAVGSAKMSWSIPAGPLGSAMASWD